MEDKNRIESIKKGWMICNERMTASNGREDWKKDNLQKERKYIRRGMKR